MPPNSLHSQKALTRATEDLPKCPLLRLVPMAADVPMSIALVVGNLSVFQRRKVTLSCPLTGDSGLVPHPKSHRRPCHLLCYLTHHSTSCLVSETQKLSFSSVMLPNYCLWHRFLAPNSPLLWAWCPTPWFGSWPFVSFSWSSGLWNPKFWLWFAKVPDPVLHGSALMVYVCGRNMTMRVKTEQEFLVVKN